MSHLRRPFISITRRAVRARQKSVARPCEARPNAPAVSDDSAARQHVTRTRLHSSQQMRLRERAASAARRPWYLCTLTEQKLGPGRNAASACLARPPGHCKRTVRRHAARVSSSASNGRVRANVRAPLLLKSGRVTAGGPAHTA